MFFEKNKTKQLKIAYIVSRIFEPFPWLFLLGILVVSSVHFNGYNRFFWAVGLAAILGFLPIFTFWLGLKKGKIKDIDLTKREERTPYILIIVFYWLLGYLLAWALAGPKLVLAMLLTAVIIAAIILIVNLYWKISNHALAITVVSLFVNELYDWQYLWLFIFIVISCWSRWVQKKHTVGQLIGGIGLGIVAWILFKLIGY